MVEVGLLFVHLLSACKAVWDVLCFVYASFHAELTLLKIPCPNVSERRQLPEFSTAVLVFQFIMVKPSVHVQSNPRARNQRKASSSTTGKPKKKRKAASRKSRKSRR
jgi:hypothetical protein